MLFAYIDLLPREGEALEVLVERVKLIRKYRRELRALEAKMKSEKQFNRKIELNAKVRNLKSQLKTLTQV
jgi:predicted RNase H-like nuclease (RuvC/YqgF family)